MKTLEEAAEIQGVSIDGDRLNLHFSPIPNWYMKCGLPCPICENEIVWGFIGEKPMITNPVTSKHLKPDVQGAELLGYGHRWLCIRCNSCQTEMIAENFD